jgi:hypothetical protein
MPYRKKNEPTEEVGFSAYGPSRKGMVAAPFSSDIALLLFATGSQEKERRERGKGLGRFQTGFKHF